MVNENSYHTLLLGMCIWLYDKYDISSNREEGKGRYDILLKSKSAQYPSLLFELKYTKDAGEDLKRLAEKACEQIVLQQYDVKPDPVINIGLAHCGKQVEMVVRE